MEKAPNVEWIKVGTLLVETTHPVRVLRHSRDRRQWRIELTVPSAPSASRHGGRGQVIVFPAPPLPTRPKRAGASAETEADMDALELAWHYVRAVERVVAALPTPCRVRDLNLAPHATLATPRPPRRPRPVDTMLEPFWRHLGRLARYVQYATRQRPGMTAYQRLAVAYDLTSAHPQAAPFGPLAVRDQGMPSLLHPASCVCARARAYHAHGRE